MEPLMCVLCESETRALSEERFCASCLSMINAASEIGVEQIYDYLGKQDAFSTYLRVTGQT